MKTLTARRISWIFILSSAVIFWINGATAQEYPAKPINLLICMQPGAGADLGGRLLAQEATKTLGHEVVPVNKPGGGGAVAAGILAATRPDGYNLLSCTNGAFTTGPHLESIPYDPLKDLIPLGDFVSVPSVFAVRSDSPLKTLEELIEYARQHPGKLKNAAGGLGTPSYFNLEILCAKNKVKITSIPFASGGEALPALLGGHVDMSSNTITTLGPSIKAGKLRALAITSKIRHPEYPDIPTTSELGSPEANFLVWLGVFAPTGVSKTVLDILIPSLENVFKNPEVVERAKKARFSVEYRGPEEFRKMIESEIEMIEKVAKSTGLK